ncbi:MAG: 4-hydroxybenzoate octaprenyltransferase [Beijerinckiaceae bacterium]|nr:4-hydroxybenzoate octaprenyltransferase [Beijerinckiaceae bacterium]
MTHEDRPAGVAAGAPLPDAAPFWLFRLAPPSWHPYIQLARLDRPIGWWLLVLPCWWSSALASLAAHRPPRVVDLLLFVVGAIVMRGAGSAYNDVVDRHVDRLVERTRGRPVASGRVSVRAAKVFFVALSFVGLAVVLCFNLFTILLGTGSLAIVAIYPFMKRVTSWPQLILGCAFAWGGLVGWAAAFGSLSAPAYWIYAGAIFWTVGYDTIYAIQDARDDPAAGIKSTARLFGTHLRAAVATLYLLAVASIEMALIAAGAGTHLWAQAGVLGFALHLAWQVRRIDPESPARALRLFRSNRNAGLILFAGLALAALIPAIA